LNKKKDIRKNQEVVMGTNESFFLRVYMGSKYNVFYRWIHKKRLSKRQRKKRKEIYGKE
jgi:hypothetical protein